MNWLKKQKWKLTLLVLIVGLSAYFYTKEEEKVWVSVAGAHYFLPNQRVDEIHVNRLDYGHTGFDGGAGMGVCCVWLPLQWRPGLVVDVRWVVSDWSESPIDDKENFDYEKVKLVGIYKATVPVERYEVADDIFVHFFEGGKVRVVPGVRDLRDKARLKESIQKAEHLAVVGQKVDQMYSPREMEEILEVATESRSKGR